NSLPGFTMSPLVWATRLQVAGVKKSERYEHHLDKAIDFVQEHVLKQGAQDDESHLEQWKDDRIASTIRSQYKNATGHEFPVKEKK
ncbi:hypothetical protein MPER_07923, partial [Moniliophthora perniciosa FA553]